MLIWVAFRQYEHAIQIAVHHSVFRVDLHRPESIHLVQLYVWEKRRDNVSLTCAISWVCRFTIIDYTCLEPFPYELYYIRIGDTLRLKMDHLLMIDMDKEAFSVNLLLC